MTRFPGLHKPVLCCIFATVLGTAATGALAQETAAPPTPLEKLGQDFARRVGGNLDEADLYLSGAGKVQLAEHASGTRFDDGEPLLMHALAGENHVSLSQDIYCVKEGKRLMISLGDFTAAVGFAIKVNPEKGTAAGWFTRETQTFLLDVNKGVAVIKDKPAAYDSADVDSSGNDILVSSDLLEKWFGLYFTYNFATLTLNIQSQQPLPAEEIQLRARKTAARMFGAGKAKLPYLEQPYGLVSQPYIDVNIGGNWFHSPHNPPDKSGDWSTIFSGDLLGFNAQAFASGGLQKPYLGTFRGSLGKQDPDGNLLGPMHATSYAFGDINTVSSSLIGGGGLERGVTVTNKPLNSLTTSTYTQINGDSQPGWDVELYRNGSYLDIRHVGIDGRYDFGNVDLLGGDNDFKLVFYGPQGEMREVHQNVGVNPSALAGNKGYYAASLSQLNTTTFENVYGGGSRQQPPNTGALHLGATYEYGMGPLGTVNFGLRSSGNGDGTYINYLQTGLATYFLDTYFNADAAYETDNTATAEIFTARRNLGKQSVLLQYSHNSPGFNSTPASATLIDPNLPLALRGAAVRDVVRASLSGPLAPKLGFLESPNYLLSATHSSFYLGGYQENETANLTTRIGHIGLSAGLAYNYALDDLGIPSRSELATVSARGGLWGGIWRAQSQYQLKPERQLITNELEYDHSLAPNLDSNTTYSYSPAPPDSALQTLTTRLNWQTSKATISPNFSIDNRHNIAAGINVHFGAGADPYSHMYHAYNAYISTAGGVAARIFLDKNGDGIYDAGDEPMPDVYLKAFQVHREVISDERGIAFIPDLPQNQLTDIAVDQATFKDSYNMTLFKGVSIRPHPGGVTRLEFPVVTGGVMDGQADYEDAVKGKQPARNLAISLVAPTGEVEKSVAAAYDGYWTIDLVKPGVYWLLAVPDNDMAPGFMVPRRVEFKANGTTLFGQAVGLTPGYNIPFEFHSENAPPDGPAHTRVIVPVDIESEHVNIEAGRYRTRLALAVAWYRLRQKGADAYYDLVTPIKQIQPDKKTKDLALMLRPKKPLDVAGAAQVCRNLIDMHFACGVQVVTRYRPLKLTPTTTEGTIDGTLLVASSAGKPQPVAGVPLGLYDGSGTLVKTTLSGPDGRYAFGKVNAGSYLLMADGKTANDKHLLRPAPEFIDLYYGAMADANRDIVLMPVTGAKEKDVPVAVRTTLGDYAAVNPTIDSTPLKSQVVVLNLGSFNSRQLMAVTWFKLNKKYPQAVANAKLLVRPDESNMSPKTGKNVLRAALPGYDVKDAWNRCHALTAAGEACAVEILPKGLPELSAADTGAAKG